MPQQELATAEAAKLVLSGMWRVSADTSSSKKQIKDAPTPVFGLRRVPRSPEKSTSGDCAKSCARSEIQSWGGKNYQLVLTLWGGSRKCEPTYPSSRGGVWVGGWRILTGGFNLYDVAPLSDWTGAIASVIKIGWSSPVKLAHDSSHLINAGPPEGPTKFSALRHRAADSLLLADTSAASLMRVRGGTADGEKIISCLGSDSVCRRAVTNGIKPAIEKESRGKDFSKIGPSAKIHALREASLPKFKFDVYFRTAARELSLTGAQKCFPRFAPSIRCYYRFCELSGFLLSGDGKDYGGSGRRL